MAEELRNDMAGRVSDGDNRRSVGAAGSLVASPSDGALFPAASYFDAGRAPRLRAIIQRSRLLSSILRMLRESCTGSMRS